MFGSFREKQFLLLKLIIANTPICS